MLGLIYYDSITEVDSATKIHTEGFSMEFRVHSTSVPRRDEWIDKSVVLIRTRRSGSNQGVEPCFFSNPLL